MSTDEKARKQLVTDWQKKHGIADDDPILATVELFEIYADSLATAPQAKQSDPPTFGEFRDSLQKLDQISKNLTNVAQDLTNEIRKSLPKSSSKGGFSFVLIILIAALTAVAAYISWEFIL